MQNQQCATHGDGAVEATQTEMSDELHACIPRPHSLLNILMPAKPPKPKNARVIRLFDFDGVQSEPSPSAEPHTQELTLQQRNHNERKAARRKSLFAAAAYFPANRPGEDPRPAQKNRLACRAQLTDEVE
jgi:hypothetical protein